MQKMLADHSRPMRSSVDAGEFLEIEPDVFSVIISFNPTEAEHLAQLDLENWQVRNLASGKTVAANPLPEFFREMTAAGGEKAYLKACIARERFTSSGQARS